MTDWQQPHLKDIAPLARALWRVVRSRWRNRRPFGLFSSSVHFVPIDPPNPGRSVFARATLCGSPPNIAEAMNGTTQPGHVSCWGCALGIERDRDRWVPRHWPKWISGDGFTWCAGCGGIQGFPPGCRCVGQRA